MTSDDLNTVIVDRESSIDMFQTVSLKMILGITTFWFIYQYSETNPKGPACCKVKMVQLTRTQEACYVLVS